MSSTRIASPCFKRPTLVARFSSSGFSRPGHELLYLCVDSAHVTRGITPMLCPVRQRPAEALHASISVIMEMTPLKSTCLPLSGIGIKL